MVIINMGRSNTGIKRIDKNLEKRIELFRCNLEKNLKRDVTFIEASKLFADMAFPNQIVIMPRMSKRRKKTIFEEHYPLSFI